MLRLKSLKLCSALLSSLILMTAPRWWSATFLRSQQKPSTPLKLRSISFLPMTWRRLMLPQPRPNTSWPLLSDPLDKLDSANRDTPSAWLPHSNWPTSKCKPDILNLLLLFFYFFAIPINFNWSYILFYSWSKMKKSKSCQSLASSYPYPNPIILFLFPVPIYQQNPELKNFIYTKLSFVNKISLSHFNHLPNFICTLRYK